MTNKDQLPPLSAHLGDTQTPARRGRDNGIWSSPRTTVGGSTVLSNGHRSRMREDFANQPWDQYDLDLTQCDRQS